MAKAGRPKKMTGYVENKLVAIEKETHAKLREIANDNDRTIKSMIKQLVDEYAKKSSSRTA